MFCCPVDLDIFASVRDWVGMVNYGFELVTNGVRLMVVEEGLLDVGVELLVAPGSVSSRFY